MYMYVYFMLGFPCYVEVDALVCTVVIFSSVQEVAELQQQLQSSEREKDMYRQQLTTTEETIRREQQQIQEMRQQVSRVCCD